METNISVMKQFYEHLGKIFYCVAAADAKVNEKEIAMLKKMVNSDWVNLEDSIDNFGADASYQIETVFDWLVENEWDRKDVLKEFKEFKAQHEFLFTEKIKGLILRTANNIAEAYAAKNKSELVFISQLYSILIQ